MLELLSQRMMVFSFGILPVLLTIIVVLCSVIIKCQKRKIEHPSDDLVNKEKFCREENIFYKIDYVSEMGSFIYFTLVILVLIVTINVRFEFYITQMVKNVGVINGMVIGLTAMAITMSVVIILYDKNYYIVFSIRDVLQKYKFAECLFIVLASCIIESIATLTLLKGKIDTDFDFVRFLILEVATIYNIIGVSYVLYVIVVIMFSEKKRELALLKQLYIFWELTRIDTSQFKTGKGWNKYAIGVNAEYLLERYLNICNCKKLGVLNCIEFVTTIGYYQDDWYRKSKYKFDRMIVILFLVSALFDWMVLQENCGQVIILNMLVMGIGIVVFNCSNKQSIQLAITKVFSDTWGYYYATTTGKEGLIRRASIGITKYSRYVKTTNSLNAFFYIGLNNGEEKSNAVVDEFKEILDYLDKNLKKKNMITFFPAFTIGYFMYEKNLKIQELKVIYNEIIVSHENRVNFERMIQSQILCLTKCAGKEHQSYRNRVAEYLQWLNKKE